MDWPLVSFVPPRLEASSVSIPLACLNGRFLPIHEASLPLHDAGFASGATVTDFCRTYRHRLYRWPDHQSRFRRDCATCLVPLPPSDAALTAAADELIRHNGALIDRAADLALVVFATPGSLPHYLGGAGPPGPPTWGLHTFPLPFARYRPLFTEGATLLVPGHQAADPAAVLPPQVKHRSRMLWWIADQVVRRRPGAPAHALALLTDAPEGNVTETALGNLLVVHKGVVQTPPRARILDGISLRVVEEWCVRLGIPFAEREVPLDVCASAEEALLCGTGFGLAGVRRIEDWQVPWPGPILGRLLEAWSDEVGVDLRQQILSCP
jgi:branched-chain amino acid aminotransferase